MEWLNLARSVSGKGHPGKTSSWQQEFARTKKTCGRVQEAIMKPVKVLDRTNKRMNLVFHIVRFIAVSEFVLV